LLSALWHKQQRVDSHWKGSWFKLWEETPGALEWVKAKELKQSKFQVLQLLPLKICEFTWPESKKRNLLKTFSNTLVLATTNWKRKHAEGCQEQWHFSLGWWDKQKDCSFEFSRKEQAWYKTVQHDWISFGVHTWSWVMTCALLQLATFLATQALRFF